MIGVWVDQADLIPNPGQQWCENDQTGWRISFEEPDGTKWSLSYRFARKIDAQMALNALDKAGWTLQRILDAPMDDIDPEMDEIVLGAMAW